MTPHSNDSNPTQNHHSHHSSNSTNDNSINIIPEWISQRLDSSKRLLIPEWDISTTTTAVATTAAATYRTVNGWKGRDLIHDIDAPVRILEYHVTHWGSPIGTTLTGIVHFTHRAESHTGYCHGGSMCSVMDDVIGWCGFMVTGECKPWSGFTVQVNTSLQKPILVGTYLIVVGTITKVERRKVSIEAKLIDASGDQEVVHATCEGLVIINKGVLPEPME
jgi:acyl-coenzyme A thioesterase PaaI-like protein